MELRNFKSVNIMKTKNSISLLVAAASLFGLNSCYDTKMDWNDTYPHIPMDELPLELDEKIAMYKAVKEYSEATIGVAIDFNAYMNDEAYAKAVNENFDQVVAGNEMKPGSLMNGSGTLNWGNTDTAIARLHEAGMSVYGHTLVWHQQAPAGYLNSLIAPQVIPGEPGANLVENGDFETGDLTGWTVLNAGDGVEVSADAKVAGEWGIKAVAGATSSSEWNLQFESAGITVDPAKTYTLSFFVKSDGAGQGRISFPDMIMVPNEGGDPTPNQYPWLDWDGSGAKALFDTSSATKQISVQITPATTVMRLSFDLGKLPGVTYHIDNVTLVDPSTTGEVNLLHNVDFETGDLTGWTAKNPAPADNPDNLTVSIDAKRSGEYGLKAITTAASANEWDLQFNVKVENLDPTKIYTLSFWVKADKSAPDACRLSFPGDGVKTALDGEPNSYPWLDWDGSGAAARFGAGTDWKLISVELVPVATTIEVDFDFGKLSDLTYFIDDVKLVENQPVEPVAMSAPVVLLVAGPIIIEKTPEEKFAILEPVFIKYITDVATHYKGKLAAWDVLNEPMDGAGQVNTGVEDLQSTGTFHWAYYLGRDYAVTAFKTARAVDPDADLFINDFNLERADAEAKLNGLMEYVKYIEENGGHVDGIGTQMHINMNDYDGAEGATAAITKASIDNMFKKLAATGKQVRVTELDIAIDASSRAGEGPAAPISPTREQQQKQAELYEYIAKSYSANVPAAQQKYGITIWGVRDDPDNQYWLPNDAPLLLDVDYQRKWAYKGFCDGLNGSDASADWTLGDMSDGSGQ